MKSLGDALRACASDLIDLGSRPVSDRAAAETLLADLQRRCAECEEDVVAAIDARWPETPHRTILGGR